MKLIQLLLLTAFLYSVTGCDAIDNPGTALLKIDIENATSTDFISVVVDFLGNEELYEIISSDSYSSCKNTNCPTAVIR